MSPQVLIYSDHVSLAKVDYNSRLILSCVSNAVTGTLANASRPLEIAVLGQCAAATDHLMSVHKGPYCDVARNCGRSPPRIADAPPRGGDLVRLGAPDRGSSDMAR